MREGAEERGRYGGDGAVLGALDAVVELEGFAGFFAGREGDPLGGVVGGFYRLAGLAGEVSLSGFGGGGFAKAQGEARGRRGGERRTRCGLDTQRAEARHTDATGHHLTPARRRPTRRQGPRGQQTRGASSPIRLQRGARKGGLGFDVA